MGGLHDVVYLLEGQKIVEQVAQSEGGAMEWLVLVILIGLIPAAIAKSKGESFGVWWVYGSLLFIIALPHALIMKPQRGSIEVRRIAEERLRKCPSCAELVKAEARKCRFCGTDLLRPESAEFRSELGAMLAEGERLGVSSVTVRASDLYRRVGRPESSVRMAECCDVMRATATMDDAVVNEPPPGTGDTLAIQYRIPRSRLV